MIRARPGFIQPGRAQPGWMNPANSVNSGRTA